MNKKKKDCLFVGSLYIALIVCVLLLLSLFAALWGPVLTSGDVWGIMHSEIYNELFRSLITTMISTSICIVAGLMAGYCLYRFVKHKRGFCIIIRSFIAVPPVVVGLALLILFGDSIIGKWLSARGFQFVFDIKGIIMAQVAVNIPFAIVQMMEHFDKIESRMISVAETCGATEVILFKEIVIPLSKNHILTTGMTLWSKAMGQFGAVVMIAGVVRHKTLVLPTSIYLYLNSGEIGKGAWVAIVLFIASISVQGIANFLLTRE